LAGGGEICKLRLATPPYSGTDEDIADVPQMTSPTTPNCEELTVELTRDEAWFKVGDQPYKTQPNFTKKTLQILGRLRAEGSAVEYGMQLFEALFKGQLRDGYKAALEQEATKWRVRMNFHTTAPELTGLWWECLTDLGPPPRRLAHFFRTPFSRGLHVGPEQGTGPVRDQRLKMLVVVSSATDVERWDLPVIDRDAEQDALATALEDLGDRIHCEFHEPPATVGRIRQRLVNEGFHVLHMVGHGAISESTNKGFILLEDSDRRGFGVGEDRLADLVANLPELRLVVLAACQSAGPRTELPDGFKPEVFVGLAPKMLEYGVPAVVAMQDTVEIRTAQQFAKEFYGALGRSKTGMVDEAMNAAREQLFYESTDGSWDWAIPVLFRSGDGVLFKPADPPYAELAASPVPARHSPPPVPEEIRRQTLTSLPALADKVGSRNPIRRKRSELYDTLLLELEIGLDDLKTFCVLLDIAFEEVEGDNLDGKVAGFVLIVERDDLVEELEDRIAAFRKRRGGRFGSKAPDDRGPGQVYELDALRTAREASP
jgi:hypothetical protein